MYAIDGKIPINNEDDSIKFEKLINISVECLMPFVRSRSITDCYTFGISHHNLTIQDFKT